MDSEPRYLLILSCSQRKRRNPGLIPAIERYDGVNFRVLRKARREGYWPENLDVLILSAKYGVVKPDTLSDDYDLPMTRNRALALQSEVSADLDAYVARVAICKVFINLGKTYLAALVRSKEIPRLAGKIRYATGGIGEKMSQMKQWLLSTSRDHKDHH